MLAVVGAGKWGKNHVRNFAQLGALYAVCDASEEVLATLRQAYPDIKTYVALAEVLADPEIEAVVLATPAAEHYAGVKAALAAGRHVFVEKPFTLNSKHAEELDRMARERNLVLMVGHLLEYHPAFVRLKQIISAGELGEIIYLYSHRLSFGPFDRPEGVIWDLAPHDLSLILRLLGEIPVSTQAVASYGGINTTAVSATINLAFPRGAHAHIFVSWLHPFKEQRLVVVGTKAMAVFDDVLKEEKLKLYRTYVSWSKDCPIPVNNEPEIIDYPKAEPLRIECEHFLHCLRSRRQPLTDSLSGINVVRVLEAAINSE